jgi:ribosomal protein L11 methyltransferase
MKPSASQSKRRPLWRVSLTCSCEGEDAASEILSEWAGQPAVSYLDLDSGIVSVATYSDSKPDWSPARRTALEQRLSALHACGLGAPAGPPRLERMRSQDWADVWKRHFKPLSIGSALLLKPSWSRRRPRKGQATIILDPGLSFGTGQHPTTSFCLRQLVVHREAAQSQSLLDIGTGSGILAIAAAKLGYAPIHAFDFDPQAVATARANARRNRVLPRLHVCRADVTKMSPRPVRRYSVVCANLISSLLIAQRDSILTRTKEGGFLILAGILSLEFALVQQAYESAGCKLVTAQTEGEWRSGTFQRSSPPVSHL